MSTSSETRARILPLVTAIAQAMTDATATRWSLVETNPDTQGLKITNGEITLFAHTSYTTGGKRLHVSGSYPAGYTRNYTPPEINDRAETTVSLDRDVKAAARQILNKLVPDVRVATAYHANLIDKDAIALAARKAFLADLAPLGVKSTGHNSNANTTGDQYHDARIWINRNGTTLYGDLRVSYDGGGDLTLHSLDADTIKAILTLVNK